MKIGLNPAPPGNPAPGRKFGVGRLEGDQFDDDSGGGGGGRAILAALHLTSR